jgi:hypothetical protein
MLMASSRISSQFLEIGRVLLWPVTCMRSRTCRYYVGSLKPLQGLGRQETGLFLKDSGFRRWPNDGNLAGPRVPQRVSTAVLHRPNPVARETPGFIGFFARRANGGEGVRTGVYRPHSHTFAQIQEILVREAQIVRWRPRASALSRAQSVLQYGPEYGQTRSTEGRDRLLSILTAKDAISTSSLDIPLLKVTQKRPNRKGAQVRAFPQRLVHR